jgi:hypothetical protein
LARLTQEGKKKKEKKKKAPISNEPRMKSYNRRESTKPHMMTTDKYLPIHPWDPCKTKENKSS